jgi:hypothetical protein
MNVRQAKRKSAPITSAHYLQSSLIATDVPDPFEPDRPLRVMRNLREHPLHFLLHKGSIDMPQYLAGDKYRMNYERAIIGASIAMDYSRDRVDGGLAPEPLTESRQKAIEWLKQVASYPCIGKRGNAILSQICGQGFGIAETARNLDFPGRNGETFISMRLKECLDALNEFMGQTAVGRRSYIRVERGE